MRHAFSESMHQNTTFAFQLSNTRLTFRSKACSNATFTFQHRNVTSVSSLIRLKIELNQEALTPMDFAASSLDTPTTNPRDYLTKKYSAYQITLQCCYKWFIMVVLSECHCSSHMSKSSVFNWLSVALPSNSAKRHRCYKKRSFFDVESHEVTSNMVSSSTTPSKSKGK